MFSPSGGFGRVPARPCRMWILIALAVCALVGGCVRRRMTIRTNPPGARVFVDDYEIGTTPVSHHFIYYGGRKIRLVKDGYETLTVLQQVPAPWYQVPPLDFFSENLVPWEIRDQQTFSYQLTPQMVVPTEELMSRAEQLRSQVRSTGAVTPVPVGRPAGSAAEATGPQIVPAPSGVGGQPVHPLPPSGNGVGSNLRHYGG